MPSPKYFSKNAFSFSINILAGKKIIGMQKGEDRLLFHYDEGGSLIMLRYNGTPYTYVKNVQGDIVGLIDNAGALVVEYKYDAWGNPVSTRTLTTSYDALAELNPFRYRGYVWDEEIKYYYLLMRYYESRVSRFINSDIKIGVVYSNLQHNIFCYCKNTPTMYVDYTGKSFENFLQEQLSLAYGHPWVMVAGSLYICGLTESSNFLMHSLLPNPPDLNFTENDEITQKIKKDKDFLKAFDDYINEGDFTAEFSFDFERDKDLFGALHSVGGSISEPYEYNGKIRYDVILTDEYDYKPEKVYRNGTNQSLFYMAALHANNLAYISQEISMIHEYNVSFSFSIDR